MKVKILFLLALSLIITHPVLASNNGGQLLDKIIILSKENKSEAAKSYIATSSHDLYDRLYKHGLTHLIPSNVEETKEQYKGVHKYIWFAKSKTDTNTIILAFKKEDDISKLDIEESFRIGFGENWEDKLSMIEQSYLFTRQYYGEEKSIKMLEAMLKK